MDKKEFEKLINHEVDWLKYYAFWEDREKLTIDSELYEDLRSIGYAKVNTPLDKRCPKCIVTSDEIITENTNVEDIYYIANLRNHEENRYTPLEVYLIIYPEKKQEIIDKLK